jgi:PHP family Zn ribbon phosphoesterase
MPLTCPVHRSHVIIRVGFHPLAGEIYSCAKCQKRYSEKDLEEGNICAGCGETTQEDESLCESCYNKEMMKDL